MTMRHADRHPNPYFRSWALPALFVSLALFLTGAAGSASLLVRGQREERAFQELAQLVGTSVPLSSGTSQSQEQGSGSSQPASASVFSVLLEEPAQAMDSEPGSGMVLSRYAELYARNEDMVGWVTVPGTEVNYPVMNTPEDPHYYLHLDFDKKESQSGTPFYGGGCEDDSDCLIIYAHNMKNDTMFGSLDLYEKKSFWEENKIVLYDTLYEQRAYEIIAVFQGRVLYQDEEGFRYYRFGGDLEEAQFNELMQGVHEREFYPTGVTAEYGDQLLLLSTCSNHGDNDRLVVVAKRVVE